MATTNDRVITHLVKKGETLESIAKKYGLKGWKPIYLYNTRVRKTIRSSNPDKLQSGTTIFIPRSKEGYEKLIRKTISLMNQLEGTADQEKARLEGYYYEWKKTALVVDTIKDVATALISARDAISKAGAAFTQSGRVMCDSIKKYYLKNTASKTVEATSGAMMSVLNYFWNDEQEGKKKQGKNPLPNDVPKHVGNIKAALSDKKIDEAIIDYVNPSKLAQMYVMIAEGESTINAAKTSDEDIYKQHLQNVNKSIKGVIGNLQLKVTKYQYEKKLLYA